VALRLCAGREIRRDAVELRQNAVEERPEVVSRSAVPVENEHRPDSASLSRNRLPASDRER